MPAAYHVTPSTSQFALFLLQGQTLTQCQASCQTAVGTPQEDAIPQQPKLGPLKIHVSSNPHRWPDKFMSALVAETEAKWGKSEPGERAEAFWRQLYLPAHSSQEA